MYSISCNIRKGFLATALATVCLALTPSAHAADGSRISIYDGGWENIQINDAIAAFVIETVFDQPTEIVASDVPDMQKQMIAGTMQINMEMWRSLMDPWVTAQLEADKIVDLGPSYERATQGFYVPTYVIKGDASRNIEPLAPDLKTVSQLAGYAKQFRAEAGQPGVWINCIVGWACREPNRVKMVTYGVSDALEPMELPSETDLNGRVRALYAQGKPFVTYYWDPSPLLGELDMTLLAEPAYSEECSAAIDKAVKDWKPGNAASQACAYKTVAIHKFATRQFVDDHPDIAATLRKMNVGTDTVRELAGYMVENEATPEATARHFFEQYPHVWKSWLTDEQVQRVTRKLAM
ncbi:glycine betaine/proline transport system substrate-binding protein [Breoghania corrubedonensis]|uniref:Glycine betaine/proline transport system substrate-binding protein n=1 Tax=Breoghania corrubedonensis TaxID=665038 RepID=A0A2T5V8Z6_9HYPH|nr:glycine betaine ABC transporter substrate-binding protein [Breoghania corrubedonensis]PTW60204.1 glycine betaine/proline transport system substrate-binding protein [Breoghania corrubedonensis]